MKKVCSSILIIGLLLVSLIFIQQKLFGAEEYRYDSKGKRDPFIPLITSEVSTAIGLQSVETIDDIKFEGVIFDPSGKSVAVLNGEIVKEGDKVSNIEIVKIYSNAITLKIYDKSYTIDLIEKGGETVER